MDTQFTMEDILSANFGEGSGQLKVRFRKTVNTRQYESEVIELETTLDLDESYSGIKRMLAATVLATQLEYACIVGLVQKQQIIPDEFNQRKQQLITACNAVADKYESLTGEKAAHVIKGVMDNGEKHD